MADFSKKTDEEIDQWIVNFERQQQTSAALYLELLEERARRAATKHGLNLERSLSALKQAAIAGIAITYGDLAKASAVEWSKARHQMNGKNGHLDRLLEICHARSLPLLTAICVNQSGLQDGELEQKALAGFAEGARRIGRIFDDELAFHHTCRAECWAWGAGRSA
ncbi:hypothetical protein [Agrobacterium tumefaciens]|uniref:hypothetical protein n=1 Tax=Agrobacterium tumefaciens TaxID=358 RepID=UPI0009755661|nr:hypothetical protein BV900_14845 [Agrobacterium tumefaciens]